MLQNKFEMPLDLVINHSKIYRFYLYVVFLLSLFGIYSSSLSWNIKLILCVFLLAGATLVLNNLTKKKMTSLHLNEDEQWIIEVDNQKESVTLYGECIVTQYIVWLNFMGYNRFGKKKYFHLLLLPDSAEKDLLRMLRVRLRFLKGEKSESEEQEAHL